MSWKSLLAILLVLGGRMAWDRFTGHEAPGPSKNATAASASGSEAAVPRVEVVRPKKGGLERTVVQPGSVYAFETVDIHAMVSGYLKTQAVDIGSRVEKGQVLAEIDVPREAQEVAEADALLAEARAHCKQTAAQIRSAEADRESAAAAVAQAEADMGRVTADHQLQEKSYARIADLVNRKALEERLLDEERHRLDSASSALTSGQMAVRTARAKGIAAEAKVEQARADLARAEAAARVAEARLARARVDLDYSRIVAPFDGVVTRRTFHPGAFINAATAGGREPLLTVARTDMMRIVVRVPDRDVAFTDPGDAATLVVDALSDREFQGKVSRIAESEDHSSRTMRVEIDLPNPQDVLREGMYGRVTIVLEPASGNLTVPTACIVKREGKGRGTVQVVRGQKVDRVGVELGAENGSIAEIVSGLSPDDQVVLRSTTTLEHGTTVEARPAG